MEKIKINQAARSLRIKTIVENVHNLAKNYANKGYSKFSARVNGTYNEIVDALDMLEELNVFLIDGYDSIHHNGEFGDDASATIDFMVDDN